MSSELWSLFGRLRKELLGAFACDPARLEAACYELLDAFDASDAGVASAHEHVLGTLAIVYHSDRFGAPRRDRIERLLDKYPESAVLNYYGAIGRLTGGRKVIEYDAELVRARLRKTIGLGPGTNLDAEARILLATLERGMPALTLRQAGFWNDGELRVLAERDGDVMLRACAECGALARCQRCGACRVAHYCSRACQKKNWRAHKKWCK